MTQADSTVKGYKTTLKSFIDPIEFGDDPATLGSASLVKTFEQSVKEKPNTVVNIFRTTLASKFLEGRLNKEPHVIITRIKTLAENREEKAQEDSDYLVEQIIAKYRDQLSNANWENGYLGNDNITGQSKNFDDNYYTTDIAVTIFDRVVVNG